RRGCGSRELPPPGALQSDTDPRMTTPARVAKSYAATVGRWCGSPHLALVLSHGSAWLRAFPTDLPTASAQAAEIRPLFAAPRAIMADLCSRSITRVTPLFAFLSLSVLATCPRKRSARRIRPFSPAGSCSLSQSGPATASATAAQTSPQTDAQGPVEPTAGPSTTHP